MESVSADLPWPVDSARDLLGRLRAGELTATQLVDRSFSQIDLSNEALNAFISLDRQRARATSESLGKPSTRRPLSGLPFSVKDTIEVAGLPATAGSRLLAEHRPRRTATVVQRMLDAGAVLVGKTNCSEFGIGNLEAWSPVGGQTHNPWAPERTPGGSSGGDSAAVAAGLVAFGTGTDFGGSIRFPAHCTGIAGLRPTLGRVPLDGQLPQFAETPPPSRASNVQRQLQTPGFLARSASDLQLLLEVGSGALLAEPRVERAVWFVDDVAPAVYTTVAAAANGLSDAGIAVRAVDDPGSVVAAALLAELRDTEGLPEIAWFAGGREQLLSPLVRRMLSRPLHPLRASVPREITALSARFNELFRNADVILMPVAAEPAFRILDGDQPDRSSLDRCTRMVTLLGLPAVVVPCGTSADGLPIGVQVVSRRWRDEDALFAAQVLEDRFGRWTPPTKDTTL
jgi:Asp-tRNA(Asn)/Glu-tRNA(Gln) amidotransferase A subunit family amidase